MATMDMAMTTMTIMEMEMAPGTMATVMTTSDGSTRNGDDNRDDGDGYVDVDSNADSDNNEW